MKLSIVIPLYNCSQTIERALNSLNCVAPNNRKKIEVICSDDGSKDLSLADAKKIASNTSGFQWQFLSHPNTGVSGARNRALNVTKGEWVMYLDDDDELRSDPIPFIEKVGPGINAVCFPIERYFDRSGKTKLVFPTKLGSSQEKILNLFTAEAPFNICAVLIRRKQIQKLFDTNMKFLEDWKFWLQNFHLFLNVTYAQTRSPIARVHLHGQNRTSCYFETGVARSIIANELMDTPGWSKFQLENLKVQHAIGQILQNKKVPLSEFVTRQCSFVLKIKAITYWLFGKWIGIIHPYQ